MVMKDFNGMKVLVTGGTGGIGLATAKKFMEKGATVAVTGKDKQDVDHAVKNLENKAHGTGAGTAAVVAVVVVVVVVVLERVVDFLHQDHDTVENALKGIPKHLGGLDILVNAAGGYVPGAGGPKGLLPTMKLNLMSAYIACEGLVEELKKSGRHPCIVNVADAVGGKIVMPSTHTNYCVSNGGVCKLTECLALTYAPSIRVNCISPGFTEHTGQLLTMAGGDEGKAKALAAKKAKATPLGRLAKPEEVAEGILYLAMQTYGTGQNIVLDGGAGLTNWYNLPAQITPD
eukprot:jgi/Chlat1/9049/Chrsp94S09267